MPYTVGFAPKMEVLSAENAIFLGWIAMLSISCVGPTLAPACVLGVSALN